MDKRYLNIENLNNELLTSKDHFQNALKNLPFLQEYLVQIITFTLEAINAAKPKSLLKSKI